MRASERLISDVNAVRVRSTYSTVLNHDNHDMTDIFSFFPLFSNPRSLEMNGDGDAEVNSSRRKESP
jgi:hypothetical protein